MRDCCITTLHHAMKIKNSGQHNHEWETRVEHDGKVGCMTDEYTTALIFRFLIGCDFYGTVSMNIYTTRKDEHITDNSMYF